MFMVLVSEAVAVANTAGEEVLIAPRVLQELPNCTALHIFRKMEEGSRIYGRDSISAIERMSSFELRGAGVVGWGSMRVGGQAEVRFSHSREDLTRSRQSRHVGNAQNRFLDKVVFES
jgi:hypothetical protein